ncbi:MAG: SpoIIE family protein phosphatase, partial [Acutalibacteraceae bacterium]
MACHCCGSSVLSGDSSGTFLDGRGREIAVISDGMGTGARAAVDGAMAAGVLETLVKAGVGFRCAMQIVNSTLLCKSEEETLATLDIAIIDLFSGHVEWIKAGAPPGFVCRGNRAREIEVSSLPLGILPQVQSARQSCDLSLGDLLLLVSDGATAAGTGWICELLEKERQKSAQQVADTVLQQAITRRQ